MSQISSLTNILTDTCHYFFICNDIKRLLTLKHFIFMRNIVYLSILSNHYVKNSLIDHHEDQSAYTNIINKKTVIKPYKC